MNDPQREQLTLGTRLAFSMQGFVGAAMAVLAAVYMGKFYVDVVLFPAGLFALAIASGRAIDAITDPAMGYISDHTRSRWGRRKPWILLGVLGNAVAFYLMMTPSVGLSTRGVMWWFLTAYVASFLFVTAVAVPRTALAAELTLDGGQRAQLFGTLAFFVGLGTIVGAVAPVLIGTPPPGARSSTLFLGLTNDPRYKMQLQAAAYVVGYLVLNAWFLIKIRERKEFAGRGETPFVPGVRRALRNRPFRIMFVSHIVTAIPVAIPAMLMPFFVQYVLKASPFWTAALIVAYLTSGVVFLPVWMKLVTRVGKLRVWLINAFIGVTGGLSLFFVGEGDQVTVLFIEIYVGMQSQVWLFLGGAMHADVIDYDELRTGKRREAQFSSLWSIIPKFALIPGAAIPLAVLGGVGYVPNQDQSPTVLLTMRVLFSLVPAALNAIGAAIMWWYPLSEHNHLKIRAGVARHAAGLPAVDPITAISLPPASNRSVDEDVGWFLDFFSTRELTRYARSGASPKVSALSQTLCFGAASFGFAGLAASQVEGFDRDPGALPTLAIVAAGLCLTGALFHGMRIRPALRFEASPVDPGVVERHLATPHE
ncbi:MAG: MFS transporter [Polyangiales bacterium]